MKIRPAIRGPKNYCDFSDLSDGDTFTWHGNLYMKTDETDDGEQMAVCLTDGLWVSGMCSESVLPVDAVITWTKQKEKTNA